MQVESAKFSYEAAKIEHEDQLKRDIPRNDERIEETTKRVNIGAERTRVVIPATLEKQRLDLEKLRVTRARSEDRLTKLQADREAMTVKAPIDGVVYYGSCDRGKWSASTGEELKRGATVNPNKVFLTVVHARPLAVRVNIPEKQLPNVRAGLKASLKPAALADTKLDAILERVGSVPLTGNNFDGRLTVALGDKAEALMPGMTCEVKLLSYDKKEALTVPPAALGTDEQDDQKHYVMLVDKDGKSKKQPVKVGKRNDKQVEILSGLKDGDQILPEAPKDKAKAESEPKAEDEEVVKDSYDANADSSDSTYAHGPRGHGILGRAGEAAVRVGAERPQARGGRAAEAQGSERGDRSRHRVPAEAAEQGRLVGLGRHDAALSRLRARARRASGLPRRRTARCASRP